VAKQLEAKKDLVVVENMTSIFGKSEMHGFAKIYKKADRLQDIEREHLLKRNSLFKDKKKKEES